MGIVFIAFSAENAKIEQVHQEPTLIWRLYEPEEEELYLKEIGAGTKPGFIGRLFGKKQVPIPTPIPSFTFVDGERQELDLDKSWDGINFCLKSLQEENVPNIFEDGKPVGGVEVGYGPAMTFDSKRVKDIALALNEISVVDLVHEFKPSEMGKIYPTGMWSREEADLKEYLVENYQRLKIFIDDTSKKGLGICVVYT